jgi:hypothetical protein
MIHQRNESKLFSHGGIGMLLLVLLLVLHYLIPSSSQVFPQHIASTTDSTESYDLLAAQQDEDYN